MTTSPQQPEFPQGHHPENPQSTPPPPAPYEQQQQQQSTPPPSYQQPPLGQQPYQQPPAGQAYPGQPTATGQQVLDPAQQRQWGMLSHVIPLVAMVLSGGLFGFVGSLIIYVMYKERGDFVRQHAANSLNIQIMTGILIVLSWPLILLLGLGLVTWGLAVVVAFVFHVLGAMKANNGELWDPPLTPRFVK